jgi:ABC-type multidrug transport system, ATPase component
MPGVRIQGLTKRYGDVAAVDDLDLTVERGELFGFLGPNGAGKTTTIRMALGLILPSGGEVELLGTPVRPDHAPLAQVGALIEEPAFWRYLSGRRNLEYFARAGAGTDRAGTRRRLARVDEILETVGLTEAADKHVKAYSQGMRQRLGLGLALLGEPDLLVLDEPTNGLDPSGMREMRLLLRALADGGTTIFVSSHLLSEVDAMCDRVGVMAQGRMLVQGPPGTLRGGAERIRVDVDDVAAARATAEQSVGVGIEAAHTATSGPGSLRVTFSDGASPADLNAALVRAGVRVHALVPERDTLEDVFLDLVEGVDVPR